MWEKLLRAGFLSIFISVVICTIYLLLHLSLGQKYSTVLVPYCSSFCWMFSRMWTLNSYAAYSSGPITLTAMAASIKLCRTGLGEYSVKSFLSKNGRFLRIFSFFWTLFHIKRYAKTFAVYFHFNSEFTQLEFF